MSAEERQEQAEQRLDREGEQLAQDLEATARELGRRLHEGTDVRAIAKKHRAELAAVGAACAGTAAIALTWGTYRALTREERRRHEIGEALLRMARHPQRVARPRGLGLGTGLLTLGALAAIVYVPVKRWIANVLGPRIRRESAPSRLTG